MLEETGLDPALLTLEITEGVLVTESEATAQTLLDLKALGLRLVLDDFGTGYSSLAYLRRFPIDGLKIDRRFIAAMDTSTEDRTIVEAIVKMAAGLQIDVVAEGVETLEQADASCASAACHAQGFYYARPMPARRPGGALRPQPADRRRSRRDVLSEPPRAAPSRRQEPREVRVERRLGRGAGGGRRRAQQVPAEAVGECDRGHRVASRVDARGRLAALDGQRQARRDRVDQRAVGLGVELGQSRAVHGPRAERERDTQLGLALVVERQQLAEQGAEGDPRTGVLRRDSACALGDLVDRAPVGGEQEVVLGGEVVLDGPGRDTGRARHGADAHRVEAMVDDDADQRVGQVVA